MYDRPLPSDRYGLPNNRWLSLMCLGPRRGMVGSGPSGLLNGVVSRPRSTVSKISDNNKWIWPNDTRQPSGGGVVRCLRSGRG